MLGKLAIFVGDVVRAKMSGYPAWPGILTLCPVSNLWSKVCATSQQQHASFLEKEAGVLYTIYLILTHGFLIQEARNDAQKKEINVLIIHLFYWLSKAP
jgi:hypothetical protein